MSLKAISILAAGALLVSFFTACGGGVGGVSANESDGLLGAAQTNRAPLASDATIVHVNSRERLATMRNGNDFPASTFLKTLNRGGGETGFLKTRVQRPSGLRTADILEGTPSINDRAVPVSASERARLEKIYRDPADDTI
jgi:hypothetical protein